MGLPIVPYGLDSILLLLQISTIDLDELVFLEAGVGSTIEIIRTNVDKKAIDVYSTISGTEV